jgi:hypothetical protein
MQQLTLPSSERRDQLQLQRLPFENLTHAQERLHFVFTNQRPLGQKQANKRGPIMFSIQVKFR